MEQSIERLLIIVGTLAVALAIVGYMVMYGTSMAPSGTPTAQLLTSSISVGTSPQIKVSNPLANSVSLSATVTTPSGSSQTVTLSNTTVPAKGSIVVTIQNADTVFNYPGSYTITLTITDSTGGKTYTYTFGLVAF